MSDQKPMDSFPEDFCAEMLGNSTLATRKLAEVRARIVKLVREAVELGKSVVILPVSELSPDGRVIIAKELYERFGDRVSRHCSSFETGIDTWVELAPADFTKTSFEYAIFLDPPEIHAELKAAARASKRGKSGDS